MTTFQDAKDSFYIALRDRLAVLDPDRTITVRGAQRPAVLVAENELERGDATDPVNTFVLHWSSSTADTTEAMPLEQAACEIRFSTPGSPELAGMDRGRVLAAMRADLDSMLQPQQAAKSSYAGTTPVAALSPIFWSGLVKEQHTETAGVVGCAVTVTVFAWKEGQ